MGSINGHWAALGKMWKVEAFPILELSRVRPCMVLVQVGSERMTLTAGEAMAAALALRDVARAIEDAAKQVADEGG